MLKPAILYKSEIERRFSEIVYDDEYSLYTGYPYNFELPNIQLRDNHYQFAIVNGENKLIGYLAYQIDTFTNCAYNFGLYSFDKGNPIIGRDLFERMEYLRNHYHRIECRMIGNNPVKRSYDRYFHSHGGTYHRLKHAIKDRDGNYVDVYIYEIVNEDIL